MVHLKPLSGGQQAVSLTPSLVTNNTVAFVLPADIGVDAYEVTLIAGGAMSNTIVANQPALWGYRATVERGHRRRLAPRVWPRARAAAGVHGRRPPEAYLALRELTRRLASPRSAATGRSTKSRRRRRRRWRPQQSAAAAALATTLTLTPNESAAVGAAPIVIKAINATEFAAWFPIPEAVPAGHYRVSISNGPASGDLDSYYNHLHPRVTTVEIKPRGTNAWGSKVVRLRDHGCGVSLNYSDQIDCTQPMVRVHGDAFSICRAVRPANSKGITTSWAIEALNGTGGTVQPGSVGTTSVARSCSRTASASAGPAWANRAALCVHERFHEYTKIAHQQLSAGRSDWRTLISTCLLSTST